MRVHRIGAVVFLIALGCTTSAWAQGTCRERAFGGIGVAGISAASEDRVYAAPSETAQSPAIFFEGAVRVACRVGVGFETMSLGTVSGFDHFDISQAISQTESERLWLITGRVRVIGSRFVALDGLGGVGALHRTLDTTNILYGPNFLQFTTNQENQASAVSFAYGAEVAFTPVRHVEVVAGLRGLRLTRYIPVTVTQGAPTTFSATHLMVTLSARATW